MTCSFTTASITKTPTTTDLQATAYSNPPLQYGMQNGVQMAAKPTEKGGSNPCSSAFFRRIRVLAPRVARRFLRQQQREEGGACLKAAGMPQGGVLFEGGWDAAGTAQNVREQQGMASSNALKSTTGVSIP